MSRLLVGLISLLMFVGCATIPRTSEIASCSQPEGYEYICYDEVECKQYIAGYVYVLKERFRMQKQGWYEGMTVMSIPVNLYYEYLGVYLIGRMEAEMIDGRMYLKFWSMFCDLEYNILHENYNESFVSKEVQRW